MKKDNGGPIKQGLLHKTPQGLMRCRCRVGTCPYGGPHARSLTRQRKDKDGNLIPRPPLPSEFEKLPLATAGTGKHKNALEDAAVKAGTSFGGTNTMEQNARLFAAALKKQEEERALRGKTVAEAVAQAPKTVKAEGPVGVAPFEFSPEAKEALATLKRDLDLHISTFREQVAKVHKLRGYESYRINSKVTQEERALEASVRGYGERLDAIVTDEEVYTKEELEARDSLLKDYEERIRLQEEAIQKTSDEIATLHKEQEAFLLPAKEFYEAHEQEVKRLVDEEGYSYHSEEVQSVIWDKEFKKEYARLENEGRRLYNSKVKAINTLINKQNALVRTKAKDTKEMEKDYDAKFGWKRRNAYIQALEDTGVPFSTDEDLDAYVNSHVNASDDEMKALFRASLKVYPKKWVDRYEVLPTGLRYSEGRGSHQALRNSHTITASHNPSTMVHEIGHGMELTSPTITTLEHCFLRVESDRRYGKDVKRSPLYNSESCVTDTLLTDYSAKTYPKSFYNGGKKYFEVLSTGMPALMTSSAGAFEGHLRGRKSPQHKTFMLGMLMLHGRP